MDYELWLLIGLMPVVIFWVVVSLLMIVVSLTFDKSPQRFFLGVLLFPVLSVLLCSMISQILEMWGS